MFTKSILNKFVCFLSFACIFLAAPASAQDEDAYVYDPIPFEEPMELLRGTLSPVTQSGLYLSVNDACHLVTTGWGWDRSSCSGLDKIFITPTNTLDTLIVEKPNSEGFVRYEDWESADRDQKIEEIWKSLEQSVKAQGEAIGAEIILDSWLVYPTLDKENNYLFYATKLIWNGEPQINIKATVFDRRGYVAFAMVPLDTALPSEEVKANIEEVLGAYMPKTSETYADFSEGDKIAAAGVLGVLAGLVGVKFGKALAVGLGALVLGLAKKLWILLFLPLIALKNKIFGKKD
ncbi:DUF2167 domain-containing protein [Hyphococcus sp.]|uniref:DUF2167 domain-containing protein n=1 Tax=Hyphococcus sp. TaxID=2038636 RepID=UPI00208AA632|nr:MAG: hypothetical protein DHS20C04_03580 [Marinicaulis sp.]